jgi:hypothetical protein
MDGFSKKRGGMMKVVKLVGVLLILVAPSIVLASGGEDCASATEVTVLPFWDEATTIGFSNDYALDAGGCTGHTTNGPDAVYRYTVPLPLDTLCVMLSVIIPQDPWNVAIYVLEEDCSDPMASCIGGADQYGDGSPEAIVDLTLTGGRTYYFIVDGRDSADAGPYKIGLSDCVVGVDEDFLLGLASPELDVVPTVTTTGRHVEVSFSIGYEKGGRIAVFNSAGRLIKELATGTLSKSGTYRWDLKDAFGQNVKPGVYFIQLQSGDLRLTKRILVTQ